MLPRLAVLCLAACLMPIEAFPSGAPESACDRLIPQHPNNRTGENYPPFTEQFPNVTNPYVLRLSDSTVQQGQSLIGVTTFSHIYSLNAQSMTYFY